MPKVTTKAPAPAPEPEAPAVDKAAEIKLLVPGIKDIFGAAGNLTNAKAKFASLLIERIEDLGESADKPTVRDILANAIAQAEGVKVGMVNTAPKVDKETGKKSGGNPTYYSLLSEMMSICMPAKEEFRDKVKAEIEKGTSFDKLRFFARHGKPNPPRRTPKEPEPFTADKLLTAAISLVLRARQAAIEYKIIGDSFDTAVESCEKEEKNPSKE